MRIEKLEFCNLNSLVGHYSIDFTHADIADVGMFIISGPTGAGKTTILDAISYALYGSTPRLGKEGVTNSRNELMSKDKGGCSASVVFEVKGQRYRVTSEHKRAQARSEKGNPFSQPKRTLAYVGSDGQTVTIETQVRKVGTKVEEITGLSFENFRRCMMLAQGEFANFLRAKGPDRAAVLSAITGTDIYGEIGKRVCDKCSELAQKVDAQQFLSVMSDDELTEYEQKRDEQTARVEALRAGIKEREVQMKWLDDLRDITERCKAAANEAASAQRELDDFQVSEIAQKMKQGQAALAVKPTYDQWAEKLNVRDALTEKLAATVERISVISACASEAKGKYDAAQTEHEREIPHLTEQKLLVQEKLIPLEKKLEAVREKAAGCCAAFERAEQVYRDARSEVEKAEKLRAENWSTLQEHEAARKALLHDAALPERIMLIKSRFRDLKAAAGEKNELPCLGEIEQKLQEAREEQSRISDGRTREALEESLNTLQAVQQAMLAYTEAADKEQACRAQHDQAREALQALPSVQEAAEAEKLAREEVELLRSLCDMKEKLADLYDEFAAGKLKTCPCCGATSPGVKPVHVEESMLKNKRSMLDQRSAELARRRGLHDAAQSRVDKAHGQLVMAQQYATECKRSLQMLMAKLPYSESEVAARIASDKASLEAWDAVSQKMETLRLDKVLAERAQAFLEEALPFTANRPATLTAAESLVAELCKRATAFEAVVAALEKDKTSVVLNNERCAKAAEREQTAADLLKKAREDYRLTKETRDALAAERAELWDADEGAVAALNRLSAREQVLQAARQQTSEAYMAANSELEKQRALEEQTRLDLKSAEVMLVESLRKYEAALQKQAFASAEAFLAACAYIPHVQEWEMLLGSLKDNALRKKTQADTLSGERDKLSSRNLTTDSRESLEAACSEMKELLLSTDAELQKLRLTLDRDAENRAANREREALRLELMTEWSKWQTLREVIGATRSADGFKRYAQQITFDYLIASANKQLARLNDRYVLFQSPNSDFGLHVIDRWSDDEKGRDSANLSGGESFIVSLALALGLSALSGGDTSIDSLFLDEGFGTLDPDTLERVLSSLEQLRSEGKLIGIISHIAELKERMPASARLEIIRNASSSHSTFAPHPAVKVLSH